MTCGKCGEMCKKYIHSDNTFIYISLRELRDCARKKDPGRYAEMTEAYENTDMTNAEYVHRLMAILEGQDEYGTPDL